jgi:hypothetical protein
MSVVVERGSARCPRCVAVADYAFIESGLNMVRYEVDCHACGQVYSEENSLVPPRAPAKREVPALPPPVVERQAFWRRHLVPLGRAAGRLRARVRPTGSGVLVAAETRISVERGPNG